MEKSVLTTLCYIEKDGKYLMLHRVKKQKDVNKDKWIGIGGHFEKGESPEECLLREAKEETGLTLTGFSFRGLVTFSAVGWPTEYMCLYTADSFEGILTDCEEGALEWVPKEELMSLNLWEGDKIFFKLLLEDAPFFSLKLSYDGDRLTEAALNGKPMELLMLRREDGSETGLVRERPWFTKMGICMAPPMCGLYAQGRQEVFSCCCKNEACKKILILAAMIFPPQGMCRQEAIIWILPCGSWRKSWE